jgi:hypothetical protein
MPPPRRGLAWAAWFAVVLGLFNSCAGHVESRDTGQWLLAGGWAPTPATGIRALRAIGSDDGDIQRYHAYANAVLGLPYQAIFVRPFEGWKVEEHQIDPKADAIDPAEVPPVVPARRLVPYRDFLVEYPPGFFLFAIPPALVAHGINSYFFLFSSFMALLLTAAVALLWDASRRMALPRAETFVFFATTCALAVGPVIVRRYDAVVSMSLCALVWGCVTKRSWAAGLGMGVGVAAKGMPLLLAPIILAYFVAEGRPRAAFWTGLIAAGIGIAAAAPFARDAGAHMLDMFAYHGQRPLEVESTTGALLVLGRIFDPAFASATNTFGSWNVVSPWDGPFRFLASALPFVALLAVYFFAWTDLKRAADDAARARSLLRWSCVALAAFMVLGKVFSPQYFTWLLPLGVLASVLDPRPAARRELLVALLLSQVIWPFCFCIGLWTSLSPIFGALVLARNLLVLVWGWQMANGTAADARAQAAQAASRSTVAVPT